MRNAPRAYYNDNDSFVAAWLARLVQAGLIPEGDVDERSILDVTAGNLVATRRRIFSRDRRLVRRARLAGWPDARECWTASLPCQPLSRLASSEAMSTNDTSGPLFSASSPSAALQWSLANRLRVRMDANGSPEYALIWRT